MTGLGASCSCRSTLHIYGVSTLTEYATGMPGPRHALC